MLNKEQYNESVELLNKWSDSYYNKGVLLATDDEYDKLLKKVLDYESNNDINPNSPTKKVGFILTKQTKFKKEKHIEKMYSLDNVFNIKEFEDWYDKIDFGVCHTDMIVMHKYDGLSLNLYYDNGILLKAITRGDGFIGENVTINAKQIKSIPNRISYLGPIEVRGEVMMTFKEFDRINLEKELKGELPFASPRNAAVGSLRNLDPNITRERNLIFKCWGVGYGITEKFPSEHQSNIQGISDIFDSLVDLGFDVVYRRVDTILGVNEYYNKVLKNRDSLEYPIDGIVVKFNDIHLIQRLGFTNKYPKWAIAFKLPAMEKVSKLISVDNQVGKTGIITPVANIIPVDIDGVLVSKVTLHNYSEINSKDLKICDSIIVIRSGDVIPKITTNLVDRRDGNELDITIPTNCPTCNSFLKTVGPNLFCTNDDCYDKLIGKLIHFVSRDGANIDGMSEATIRAILKDDRDNGKELGFGNKNLLFHYIRNIYNMTIDDFLKLDGFNIKKATNLHNAIQYSKYMEMFKLLDSLSIPNIGTTSSKAIVKKYGMDILNLTVDDLISVDGIGIVQAKSYVEFMNKNKYELMDLIDNVFTVVNLLEQMGEIYKISATGTFPKSRQEVIALGGIYLNHNYEYTDKLSKDVKLLIVGENPSSKLEKAKKLGIEIKYYREII